MTGLIQRARERVQRFVARREAEASARRFVAFCQRKWPVNPAAREDSVVLLGYFPHKIATYCNGHVANYIARRTNSRLETFAIYGRRDPLAREAYHAMGAQLGLDQSHGEPRREEMQKKADEIFAGLKTKWDLLALRYEGLKIGDLIYDTYLRFYEEPTVKLEDPRLRELIFQTLFIYAAVDNYLKTKKVVAFIADDYCYHECGVLTRLLMRRGVPIYIVCFGSQFFLYKLYGEEETGWDDYPIRWPYHAYPKVFRTLPSAEQERCLAIGKKYVEDKLAGKFDRFTLRDRSAFAESDDKVFTDSGKPRIVVLLHDFIDAPHGFRWMLFPDFYDWIYFLLEKASETDFEWYIKPHPSSWDPKRQGISRVNMGVVDDLLKRFPKIKLLEPTVSNRQIVKEGIAAMFTMYGTAGHEFARLGIPTVNAGDNPHIAYHFNYHPTTVEEYADLIARADQLKCEGSHREIDEYCFMNFFYTRGYLSTGANPLPPSFFEDSTYEMKCAANNGYDLFILPHDAQREAEVEKYYDAFFHDLPKA